MLQMISGDFQSHAGTSKSSHQTMTWAPHPHPPRHAGCCTWPGSQLRPSNHGTRPSQTALGTGLGEALNRLVPVVQQRSEAIYQEAFHSQEQPSLPWTVKNITRAVKEKGALYEVGDKIGSTWNQKLDLEINKPGVPVPDQQNLSHPATPIPHPPEAWSLVTDPLPSGITVNQGITGQAWHIATQHLLFKCEWLFWIPKIHEFLFLVEISSTWLLFKINHKVLCMSLQKNDFGGVPCFCWCPKIHKKSSTHALKKRKTYW